MRTIFFLSIVLVLSALFFSCSKTDGNSEVKQTSSNETAKVTFLEIGSVNCIPCKQMQPVMRSIEEKYKGQVKVVFHDVWKDKEPAQKYGIRLIPTQVFLDENGNEFFRHEGFYPESDIDKLLQSRGVNF
jgi:thioredoxin 1